MHAGQFVAPDGKAARRRTGRQQQRVVRQIGAGRLEPVRVRIDGDRLGRGAQLDAAIGIPFRGVEDRGIPPFLSGEIALRQGWTLVGRMGFGGDDRDVAVVPLVAKRLGRRSRGDPAADDHDVRHGSS
ncbi:hypothetical protein GCM10009776_32000 [Microbacterium deminutum]|uniref:Uncharacterized protein n=1 Tax=Microbacterium deminutum TaxID=344164 RepID=A0ABP5CNU8_9MICO